MFKRWTPCGEISISAIFRSEGTSDLISPTRAARLVAHHGISFNDNYAASTTYDVSFAVTVNYGTNLLADLDSDFTQATGTSTLVTTSIPAGTGTINISKTGSGGSGPDSISYNPNVEAITVSDMLTDGGADLAILSTVIESGPANVPEPTSMAILVQRFLAWDWFTAAASWHARIQPRPRGFSRHLRMPWRLAGRPRPVGCVGCLMRGGSMSWWPGHLIGSAARLRTCSACSAKLEAAGVALVLHEQAIDTTTTGRVSRDCWLHQRR